MYTPEHFEEKNINEIKKILEKKIGLIKNL